MIPDLRLFIQKLAERPAKIIAPALADPDLAKEALTLSFVLGSVAEAVDQAPGRLRHEANDLVRILSTYAADAEDGGRFKAILDQPWNEETLSGMVARNRTLKAALIDAEIALENTEADWARQLRRDILAAFLRWTEPLA